MAELSQETIAIIDRLKAEGDLNRNTGTNSIRSMNIKLDKFDSLFRSINANVIEQTSMLKMQLGIANDAQERARTQEQFDEVTPPTPTARQTDDYSDGNKKADTNAAINKMGDAIAKTLSLKNLAIGAGAGFVGYNLLKGFIDTKYDGAFTEMEEGLGGFGKELKKFSLDGMDDIKTTIKDMNKTLKDLTGPDGSITKLNNNISDLSDKMREIADMTWVDVAAKAIGAISLITLGAASVRYGLNRMSTDMEAFRKAQGGRTWLQRIFNLNKDGSVKTQVGGGRGSGPLEVEARKAEAARLKAANAGPKVNTTNIKQPTIPKGVGTSGAGSVTPITSPKVPSTTPKMVTTAAGTQVSKPQIRTDSIGKNVGGKGTITKNAAGRLVYKDGPNAGKFVNDADALKAMENSLDSRYSKVFGRLIALFKMVKIAAAVLLMYEIYTILEDDDTYPTKEDKIKAMGPIIGNIVGGLGGAALGAAMGSIPPLTGWGTLIGGIGGGILGAFMGGYLGEIVAKWAFAEDPKPKDIDTLDNIVAPGENAPPMPTGGGHGGRAARIRWDKKYGKTHNKDGTPKVFKQGTNRGDRSGVNKTRRTVQQLKDAEAAAGSSQGPGGYTPNEIQLQEQGLMGQGRANVKLNEQVAMLGAAGAIGSGGVNVVNNNAPNIAPVMMQQGGSDVTQVSYNAGGGSGDGTSLRVYGLTGAIA
jgi:hypothetical protein